MDKHKRALKKAISKYENNSNVLGIILFGSLASNTHHPNSDIDLYIISSDKNSVPSEIFSIDEINIQLQWRTLCDFKEKSFKRLSTLPVTLKGKLVFCRSKVAEEILEESKEFHKQGPISMDLQQLKQALFIIDDGIHTLHGMIQKKRELDMILYISDILIEVLKCYYDYSKWWWPTKKHLASDLYSRDQLIAEQVRKIITSEDINTRLTTLTKLADKLLRPIRSNL